MKPIIPLAAGAAVVVLAVVLGMQFLPGDSGIAGPTSSPATPSASPTAVGGQFTFADVSIDMNASSDGSTLSGTVVGSYSRDAFTIELQCLRQFDDQTWMLAGMLTESAVPDQAAGSWAAVIVRDGSPQQAGIWTEAQATADDCEEFVGDIPDNAVDGLEQLGPIDEGSITLPPAPASNDVSGRVTFQLGDNAVAVEVDASADGAALSGTAVVSFAPDEFTIALECSREFDDTTWILAGTTTESTTDNSPVGSRSAILVRDGAPQEVILWFEDPPPAEDCAGFLEGIPEEDIVNAGFTPVTEGEISLP